MVYYVIKLEMKYPHIGQYHTWDTREEVRSPKLALSMLFSPNLYTCV